MKRAMIAFAVALVGCAQDTNLTHLVIPDGHTGPVVLAEVEGYGAGYETVDDRYVYEIPASGILCVGSYAPFRKWNRLTGDSGSEGPMLQWRRQDLGAVADEAAHDGLERRLFSYGRFTQ